MFSEGIILFFNPFYFKNGDKHKAKYFIVIKAIDDKVILASLPSSQDYVPAFVDVNSLNECTCIELPEANFNCYLFPANKPITTNRWAFPKNTFLYGHQLDNYEINTLVDIYPVEGIDYQVVGILQQDILEELINCFKQSASVKRKFRKLL